MTTFFDKLKLDLIKQEEDSIVETRIEIEQLIKDEKYEELLTKYGIKDYHIRNL